MLSTKPFQAQTPTTVYSNQGGMSLPSDYEGQYNAATTYALGQVVNVGTAPNTQLWYSRQNNNVGNTPAVGSLYGEMLNFQVVAPGLQTNGTYNNLQDLLNVTCTGGTSCSNANGTTTINSTGGSSTGGALEFAWLNWSRRLSKDYGRRMAVCLGSAQRPM